MDGLKMVRHFLALALAMSVASQPLDTIATSGAANLSTQLLNTTTTTNFTLPEESKEDNVSMFKEIIFTDLQREEATKLVAEYNKVI